MCYNNMFIPQNVLRNESCVYLKVDTYVYAP